jgi:cytochrome c-type biogenesis protein
MNGSVMVLDITHLLYNSLQQDALLWVLLLAFGGGVLSALLPCSVSFLPLTIAYMGGSANQGPIPLRIGLFVVGLCLSLTVLGLLAALLGLSLGTALAGWGTLALGLLAVVMGLHMLHIVQMPMPAGLSRMPQVPLGGPLVLGFLFGLTASPCSTPILTLLLGYIAKAQQPLLGIVALFCYALGQSVLLLLAGWGAGVLKHRATLLQAGEWINRMSGIILLGFGVFWIVQGWTG